MAFFLAGVCGCGDNHSAAPDSAPLGDSAPDARADAAPDTPPADTPPDVAIDAAPGDTIHGTAIDHYVEDSGVVDEPRDLSAWVIGSLAPDGSLLAGSGDASGNFSFPITGGASSWLWSTVDSPYMTHAIYQSTSTSPDLGTTVGGRPDATYPILETDVAVTIGGMAPWDNMSALGDTLEMFSSNVGGGVYGLDTQLPILLASGDTSIQSSVDWSFLFFPTIDSSVGDRITVAQLADFTAGADDYRAITRFGTANPVDIVDGQPAALSVFLAAPTTKTFALAWQGSQFASESATAGPNTVVGNGGSFSIVAEPSGGTYGLYGLAADLVTMSLDDTLHADGLTYANPYGWDELAFWSFDAVARPQLGAAPPGAIPCGNLGYRPLSQIVGGVIAPGLSGVQHATIGGMDATVTTTLSGVGLAPAVTWDPPAIGAPTVYQIGVQHLVASGITQNFPVAYFYTKDTSFTLPAGVLVAGQTYLLTITAETTTNDETASPSRRVPSYEHFVSVTSEFTP